MKNYWRWYLGWAKEEWYRKTVPFVTGWATFFALQMCVQDLFGKERVLAYYDRTWFTMSPWIGFVSAVIFFLTFVHWFYTEHLVKRKGDK